MHFCGRDTGGADNFAEVSMFTAGIASADDRFAQSFALAGETLIVSSESIDDVPACSGNCENTGAAYAFCLNLDPPPPGSIFEDGFENLLNNQCKFL